MLRFWWVRRWLGSQIALSETNDAPYTEISGDPAVDGTLFYDTTADGQLWEPGYAYGRDLKVVNNGNLALKWQLYFTDLTSTGAAQIADVLDVYVIGVDDTENALTQANRIGTLSELAGGLVTGSELLNAKESTAFSVVLKMRDDAGNLYKGCSVSFNVELRATQAVYEEDGFGNSQYDALADGSPDQSWGSLISGTAVLEKPAEGWQDPTTLTVGGASVLVPAAAIAADAEQLRLTIMPTDELAEGVTVNTATQGTISYEISVTGIDPSSSQKFTVNLPIGKDLTGVVLYHAGEQLAASYDAGTGYLTFETESFSPFTIVYDKNPDSYTGASVSGIAGFEGKIFSSVQEAYDAISPVVAELAGLEQGTASADAFDALFTNNGVITWTIYGKQTVDNELLFSFGRKASYYGERNITAVNVQGGNETAGLVLNVPVRNLYNWWGPNVPTASMSFSNLVLEQGSSLAQMTFTGGTYGYTYKLTLDNCVVDGKIYIYWNNGLDLTVNDCEFNNTLGDSGSYALFVQGDSTGTVKFTNNIVDGYTRGVNFQRNQTEFFIDGNTFRNNSEVDRAALQLTSASKFTVTNNVFEDTIRSNAIWLWDGFNNPETVIANNTIGSAYSLSGYKTEYSNVTAYENTVASTLCWEKGASAPSECLLDLTGKKPVFTQVSEIGDLGEETVNTSTGTPLTEYVCRGGMFQLTDNITVQNALYFTADTVIDLNGYTITKDFGGSLCALGENVTVTFKNGSVNVPETAKQGVTNYGDFWYQRNFYAYDQNVTLNFSNVSITLPQNKDFAAFKGYSRAGGLSVTINGASVTGALFEDLDDEVQLTCNNCLLNGAAYTGA